MHIWTDLVTREGIFLLVVAALGAGPASFLSDRLDAWARVALAPVLGLCVGVALTDTLVKWFPVRDTYWLVVVLACVSVAVATWRVVRSRIRIRVPWRELSQVIVIAVCVLGPPSLTLHARATVGPVGLNVYDAAGYVPEIDSMETHSIDEATALKTPMPNMTLQDWTVYASGFQNMDATALMASVDELTGLGATDTQNPFLITILFVGALGIFAAFRYVTDSRGWAGVLAAGLFGGSFFMQLWADSSQAAICGLAMIGPFFVVGAEALKRRRIRDFVLLSLIVAGILTVYPLFAPAFAVGGFTVVAWCLAVEWRGGRLRWRGVVTAVAQAVGVLAVAAAFTPVPFGRDLRYWAAIIEGKQNLSTLPIFALPVGVVPGWLLQTRQFYYLLPIGVGGLKEFVWAVVLPLLMIVVIVIGFAWRRRLIVVVPFALTCVVLAEYTAVRNGCNYCAQRNLLPIAPLGALTLGIGVAYLARRRTPVARVIAALASLIIVFAVGERLRFQRDLILDTAYLLDSPDRGVLAHLPRGHPVVEVEGFGENFKGPAEMPLVYDLVNERDDGRASMAMQSNDYESYAYLLGSDQPAAFNPNYRYVLTRFAGLHTDRRIIASDRGVALEERTQRLDVTLVSGLGAPLERYDPAGDVWVQLNGPMLYFVTGAAPGRPAWVRLVLATEEPVTVVPQAGDRARVTSTRVTICMLASGTGPWQTASVHVLFSPIAAPTPAVTYPPEPPVVEGVELLSMTASQDGCGL